MKFFRSIALAVAGMALMAVGAFADAYPPPSDYQIIPAEISLMAPIEAQDLAVAPSEEAVPSDIASSAQANVNKHTRTPARSRESATGFEISLLNSAREPPS